MTQSLVQSHTACRQQSQDSNPGGPSPESVLLAPGPLRVVIPDVQ